jgi:hypothetical protein
VSRKFSLKGLSLLGTFSAGVRENLGIEVGSGIFNHWGSFSGRFEAPPGTPVPCALDPPSLPRLGVRHQKSQPLYIVVKVFGQEVMSSAILLSFPKFQIKLRYTIVICNCKG